MLEMRLLILNDMLWGGGRERRITQLIVGLSKRGVKDICLVLLDEGIDYPEILSLGIEVHIIKRSSNRDWKVFTKLDLIVQKFRPTAMIPWSLMTAFYASPISFLRRIPLISAHVVDCNRPASFTINNAARIIANLFSRKIVSNCYAGHHAYKTPRKKQIVIRNGFTFDRISPQNGAQRADFINNEIAQLKIAMVGRMDGQKDFTTFIAALQNLRKSRDDFEGFCVGKGPHQIQIIESLTDEAKNYIKFPGFISPIESLYPSISIGVLCTNPRLHSEGISNVLIEMMAFGIPVIATRGGGTEELIEDRVDGLLIDPGNPKQLTASLVELVSNKELSSKLSENAMLKIRENFSLDSMCEEFLRVLMEVKN